MKYIAFLIAACVDTENGTHRIAETGHTLETAGDIEDRLDSSLFWSLYGIPGNSGSEWIGDYSSQAAAIDTYQNLTGIKAKNVTADMVHIDLAAPAKSIPLEIASNMAIQIEQMQSLFDDNDGAIAAALQDYYDYKPEIEFA